MSWAGAPPASQDAQPQGRDVGGGGSAGATHAGQGHCSASEMSATPRVDAGAERRRVTGSPAQEGRHWDLRSHRRGQLSSGPHRLLWSHLGSFHTVVVSVHTPAGPDSVRREAALRPCPSGPWLQEPRSPGPSRAALWRDSTQHHVWSEGPLGAHCVLGIPRVHTGHSLPRRPQHSPCPGTDLRVWLPMGRRLPFTPLQPE